jgi:hypothetical protein
VKPSLWWRRLYELMDWHTNIETVTFVRVPTSNISTLSFFTFMWPCIVTNFLTIKPNRCTNFSNVFWNETLHVSDSSSLHHQDLFVVHSAMVYVIHVCRHLSSSSRIRMERVSSWSCCSSKAVCDLPSSWVSRKFVTTRCCNYSLFELLMMGECFTRNM